MKNSRKDNNINKNAKNINIKNNNIKNKSRFLAYPAVLWMAAFIIIPLCLIIVYGLTAKEDGRLTLDNLKLIAQPVYRKALWLSLKLSFENTVICLLLAYPLALILKNMKIKSSSFIILVFMLPMWMNFLLRTLAWLNILENNGIINIVLRGLGFAGINIINTNTAVLLGMVYNFLPFMILPLYNILAKIDDNVIHAARDLGAGSLYTFTRIILPLSLPGVISGITMVFVPSLTTFVISDILGGAKISLIGNLIEGLFKKTYNMNAGSGLSLVLMVFILISMILVNKYDKDGEGAGLY